MAESEDSRLIEAAKGGDRAALEALLARHQARIYRFGMKMCRNPEDAQDILQETLIAMARGVRDFRGASSVSTWLFTIARSFCIKKRRKSVDAPAALASIDREASRVADPSRLPDEALADAELRRGVERAIGALEPDAREVLVLRDVEGLTAPEVATVLGISAEAVKSRLHRARLAVRADVASLLGGGDAPATAGCRDVLTLFSRHLEDEISQDLCAEMDQHLGGCARCRGSCDSLKRTLAVCRSQPVGEVPAPVQESVRAAFRSALPPAP